MTDAEIAAVVGMTEEEYAAERAAARARIATRCLHCSVEQRVEGSDYCSEAHEVRDNDPRAGFMGVSQKRLREVFDLVKNKENWKLPIATVIPKSAATCTEIEAAIGFYVGGGADVWSNQGSANWCINAPGYYQVIGA